MHSCQVLRFRPNTQAQATYISNRCGKYCRARHEIPGKIRPEGRSAEANGAAPNLVLADARQSRAEKEARKECDKKRALDIFADGNSTFRNERRDGDMMSNHCAFRLSCWRFFLARLSGYKTLYGKNTTRHPHIKSIPLQRQRNARERHQS